LSSGRKAAYFYGLTLALAVLLALLAWRFPTVGLLEVAYAFTPLVAVAIMMLIVTRDGRDREGRRLLGLHRLGLPLWPFAILGPLLVLGFSYGVVWSTGLAEVARPEGPFGSPLAPLWIVLAIVGLTLTQSLGEELGWSGYLLPQLRPQGVRRAMVLRGLGQGIWHLPLILLANAYGYTGNRLINVILVLAVFTVAGFLYGYLRFTTDSVWPPTIAHSAHNVFWLVASAWTVGGTPLATEYLAGESGLLVVAGYGVLAAYVLWRMNTAEKVGVRRGSHADKHATT
jgi:membrane protease YdiL (CAAX protease family)